MEEHVSAIVTAQSTSDGSLSLVLALAEDSSAFDLPRAVLTLTVHRLELGTVRIRIANPATGSIAYFQSALPAIAFARELGLRIVP